MKIKGIVKNNRTELVWGMLCAVLYCVGKSIYETASLCGIREQPGWYLLYFIAGSLFFAVLLRGIYLLPSFAGRLPQWEPGRDFLKKKKGFFILSLILLVVYGICYISYFPGTFAYDAPPQTYQAYGYDPLNTHHPVLHTLFWAVSLRVGARLSGGSEAGGLVVYSVCQLLVVLAVTMLTVYVVWRMTDNIYAVLAAYLYYLLTPMLHVMSIALTKDVLFSCFLILFGVSLLAAEEKQDGKTLAAVGIFALLSCLFRNNMIYVVILMLLAAFMLRYSSKLRAVLVAVIMVYYLIMKVFFPLLGIEEGEKCESFPAVLQQLSGIYVKHSEQLGAGQKEEILCYLPDAECFNRHFADPVKNNFNQELYEEDRGNFWNLWLSVFLEAPYECFCLLLDLNVDYWYPNAAVPDPYSQREYIETDTWEREIYWVDNAGFLPGIHEYYEAAAEHRSWFMNLPLLRIFYSLAFPFVSMMVCIYLMIRRRSRKGLLFIIALVGLFLTFLLGPVSNFRYIYGYYLAMPLYFSIAAVGGGTRKLGNEEKQE